MGKNHATEYGKASVVIKADFFASYLVKQKTLGWYKDRFFFDKDKMELFAKDKIAKKTGLIIVRCTLIPLDTDSIEIKAKELIQKGQSVLEFSYAGRD